MARPSKFTAEVRRKLLEALQVGVSRETACAIAGISYETLRRWLDEGRKGAETSAKHKFGLAVLEAEAHPKARAMGVVYQAWEDKPELAWKFLERREHGFAPPVAHQAPAAAAPVLIQLSLSDGAPLALAETTPRTVIEVGAVEPNEATGGAGDPTPIASA